MSFYKIWNALQPSDWVTKAVSWLKKLMPSLYEPKVQLLGKMEAFLLTDDSVHV